MIESQKKHHPWEKNLSLLTIVCIAAYLVTFAVINFSGFPQLCDSDMYADTYVAKRMWEQKTLFPQGWIYSNQYFVVATPVLAALFYGLTGNVNTGMALATELMTILILVSFFWLLRAVADDFLIRVTACLVLIASVIAPDGQMLSWNAQLFFLQASYYACYLITMFVVFGDYIRSHRSSGLRPIAWGVSLLLSFATGMQSLRQTAVMVLPILACEGFLALRRVLLKQKPWSGNNVRVLIRALSYGIANFAGLLVIKLLNVPQSTLFENTGLGLTERLSSAWGAICYMTGLDFAFNENYPAFYTVFFLFLFSIAFAAGILWLIRIKRPETEPKLCWLLFLVSIFGVLLATVLLDVAMRHIYIFMWYPLVALSMVIILQKMSRGPKYTVIVLACILSLGNLYYSYIPTAQAVMHHESSDAEMMSKWAVEEGYEYVYGDWFTAPRVAVHSGGTLEAGYWWEDNMYTPISYNIASDIYDEEENQSAIYVFTSKDEEQGLLLAREQNVELTKVAEFGDYRAYASPVPLMKNQTIGVIP